MSEGTGGMQALDDDDKVDIEKTIDDEILKRQAITFRSTPGQPAGEGDGLGVQGDLTLRGTTRPLTFDVVLADDGRLSAVATVKQTDWEHQAVLRAVRGAEGRPTRSRSRSTPPCRRRADRPPDAAQSR